MSGFDPGDGWRKSDADDGIETVVRYDDRGRQLERWVRVEPVPALPTEPYTVIRVTPPSGHGVDNSVLYVHDGTRFAFVDLNSWLSLESVSDAADFTIKVLSEPRAVTAKAVLDRIASEPWAREIDLTKWRFDFGVES